MTVIEELEEVLGEVEVGKLLDGFLATLLSMQQEFPDLDPKAARSRAHQLRGSAGALGLMDLSDAAADVDRALAEGPAPERVERMLAVLAATVRELEASPKVALARAS